jgi:hypothetical protein
LQSVTVELQALIKLAVTDIGELHLQAVTHLVDMVEAPEVLALFTEHRVPVLAVALQQFFKYQVKPLLLLVAVAEVEQG